jgi:peptidoglycan/LPS O-acetylase OafA/YrhL
MGVTQRATIPTSAQRRWTVLEDSRVNCTIASLVLATLALLSVPFLLATIASTPDYPGGVGTGTVVLGIGTALLVAFSAGTGAAALVLSAMRDAAEID